MQDISLRDYIAFKGKHATIVPHTAGRYQKKRFRKAQVSHCALCALGIRAEQPANQRCGLWLCLRLLFGAEIACFGLANTRDVCAVFVSDGAQCPIAERLANSLMRHGRNSGKKVLATRIVRSTMEIIHLLTDQNPVQVLVDAVVNSGPREDSTRVGSAGVVRRQSVDMAPFRRVNQALYLITTGAREASFRNVKTIAECLADEIINAARGSSNSYAIKKKDEIERVAKANR